MQNHFDLSDNDFQVQFRNTELNPELFSHEAHLRLAWIHIKNYGEERAIENLTDKIQRFAQKHGAPDKFNMTLTVAAIKAVWHFFQKSKSKNFKDFMEEFPRLKSHFKGFMAAHYGFDIHANPKAKVKFLAPDLLPFD